MTSIRYLSSGNQEVKRNKKCSNNIQVFDELNLEVLHNLIFQWERMEISTSHLIEESIRNIDLICFHMNSQQKKNSERNIYFIYNELNKITKIINHILERRTDYIYRVCIHLTENGEIKSTLLQ
jgi:hypothetical protein